MKTTVLMVALAGLALSGAARAETAEPVLDTYSDIAAAAYKDALASARTLSGKIDALVASPSDETLAQAREAWVAARRPYQQTEVYRFGNSLVDAWEGKVNAWPLDEGLIDYVDAGYGNDSPENAFYTANVIANPVLELGGRKIDASKITPALLAEELQELAASRPMSRPAITPSSFSCGVRTSTEPGPAPVPVRRPISIPKIAPAGIATVVRPISRPRPIFSSATWPKCQMRGQRVARPVPISPPRAAKAVLPRSSPVWAR